MVVGPVRLAVELPAAGARLRSSVDPNESPDSASPDSPSHGKLSSAPRSAERRLLRRRSPYPPLPREGSSLSRSPCAPPQSSVGLSSEWSRFGFASLRAGNLRNSRLQPLTHKPSAQLTAHPTDATLPQPAGPSVGSVSARESRRTKLTPIVTRGVTAPSEQAADSGEGSRRIALARAREERRVRKAAAVAAACERRAAEAAATEAAERREIVGMLREYEEEAALPASPASELMQLAEDAAGDAHLCRELRAKLRAAVQATVAGAAAAAVAQDEPPPVPSRRHQVRRSSGDSSSSGTTASRPESSSDMPPTAMPPGWLPSNRPAMLRAHELPALIARLAGYGEPRSDDAFVGRRVFDGLDKKGKGELGGEVVVKGLFPAYSRARSIRLRWVWQTIYCPPPREHLTSVDIFGFLNTFPEGCRLEEDLLALINLAAAKRFAGEPVRITVDEYIDGLRGHRAEEADVLGLRRRRRGSDASRMLRARARSVMLAQQWSAVPVAAGEGVAARRAGLRSSVVPVGRGE